MEEIFDLSIRRDRLYKQVADQIQELIIAESLRAGDKLPGERELAERLGISRTVVREAIRTLSVRGLVRVKAGCGTYIQELTAEDAAAPIELLFKLRQTAGSLDNLYEIRRMMEIEIAGLAAERATDEDYAALEDAIEGMAASVDDPDQLTEYDMAFHSALAVATQNELFSLLLSMIASVWHKMILVSAHARGAAEAGLQHHRNLLGCVSERDPERAREAMRAHIRESQRLVEAVDAQAIES